MTQADSPPPLAALKDMDDGLRRLSKSWHSLKEARHQWNFKSFQSDLALFSEQLSALVTVWDPLRIDLNHRLQLDQEKVNSPLYPPLVEEALRKVGIPLKGDFPTYEFPPFKLVFNREQGVVRLSMGRRSQQSRVFEPETLARWVGGQYQQLMTSRFDPERFCKDLLVAYGLLTRLNLQGAEVGWGHPVPLKDIYQLLTLRHGTRQEYPEGLFTFDLSRLQELFDVRFEHHRFELVPSRNASGGYLLVNHQGQERRVNSLVIHASEE